MRNVRMVFNWITTLMVSNLGCRSAARCCIMQEDSENVRHNVRQIQFKVRAESADDLLQQQDNGVLQ